MAIAYLDNGAIEIPGVQAQKLTRQVVGERGRTAGGKLRQDVVAVKRAWRLECKYLTTTQYNAIIDHLNSLLFGATTFWLDELGGTAAANSIAVYVDIEDDERVQFARDGTWYENGHSITLTVTEQ